MRRMSAHNHRGQEVEDTSIERPDILETMIFSHIDDRMSCKPEWVHICRKYEPHGWGR